MPKISKADQAYVRETLRFLEAAHPATSNGLLEIRLVGPRPDWIKASYWPSDLGELEKLIPTLIEANRAGCSIFYSCGRRNGQNTTGDMTWPGRIVLADFDDGPGIDEAKARIAAANMPEASALILSGSPGKHLKGNVHAAWFTDRPLDSVSQFCAIQEGLADLLGSCQGVALSSQVFRLCGPFLNPKKGGTRVELVELHPDRVYDPERFPAAESLPEVAKISHAQVCEIRPGSMSDRTRDIIRNGIPDGLPRRGTILSVQKDLAARGWSLEERIQVGLDLGERAGHTGEDLQDVRRSARNAAKGNPQPGFAEEEQAVIVDLDELDEMETETQPGAESSPYEHDDMIEASALEPAQAWPEFTESCLDHHLLGEVMREIMPYTEADPMAVAVNFLSMIGSVCGRSPHVRVGSWKLHANLFFVTAAETTGRKGTATRDVLAIMDGVDPDWRSNGYVQGVNSGEALVHRVRDATYNKDGEVKDEGVSDKRSFVMSEELSSVFKVSERSGSILTEMVRVCYDAPEKLSINNKNTPTTATGALITVAGHVTPQSLHGLADVNLDVCGGTLNRFVWVLAKNSKFVPFGTVMPAKRLAALQTKVKAAVALASSIGEVKPSKEARQLVDDYRRRVEFRPERGLYAYVTARAPTNMVKIALVLALTRGSRTIEVEDVQAAIGISDYALASAKYLFTADSGDTAAEIRSRQVMTFLEGFPEGVSLTTVARRFHATRDKDRQGVPQVYRSLELLERRGLIRQEKVRLEGSRRHTTLIFPAGQTEPPAEDQGLNAPASINAPRNAPSHTEPKTTFYSGNTEVSGINAPNAPNAPPPKTETEKPPKTKRNRKDRPSGDALAPVLDEPVRDDDGTVAPGTYDLTSLMEGA